MRRPLPPLGEVWPIGGENEYRKASQTPDRKQLSWPRRGTAPSSGEVGCLWMSPFWIWTQVAIVVFVVIGMIIAITKLA
jgi:hypothetical protein